MTSTTGGTIDGMTRKKGPQKPEAAVIDRNTALWRVAKAYRDRTHFIATVSPGMAGEVAQRLEGLRGWEMLLDSGGGAILATSSSGLVEVTDKLSAVESAGVVLASKSVDSAELGDRLGQEIPEGKDLFVIGDADDGELMVWPTLFVDALDLVDPVAAAQMRAQMTPLD
ncbi:hypothetical protein ACIGXM_28610 [Kitasatospora sp. NPDC052896]|uniref:hypothetical protein n=1 Tax=Kitasatospora sp. NPDC052896 TaxID=3364061 RepID=UPI0037CB19A5